MFTKSSGSNDALEIDGGIAAAYGNLGSLYQTRGGFQKAEEMYNKCLLIEKAQGRKEGMAAAYGNLGSLYQTQGEFKKAEEMYERSLILLTELGSPKQKLVQTWLKNLHQNAN